MNETRSLVQFALRTRFEDLPSDVVQRAKVFVLDNYACGIVGASQPGAKMVEEMLREGGGREECTIFGRKWRANLSGAALLNGVMIGGFETDHGCAPASGHPSGTIFPAAMAIAEREHKDGKAFITASVLGYETLCRIGIAATRAVEDERGFHGPGTNGQFGAAVAAGKLLGFDEATLLNAMGIAGTHSAGLMEFVWEGAMTKRIHLGRGAQMGLESALLARKGFTGPSTVLEGKFGFFNVFSPSPRPELLLKDIGKVWLGSRLQIKPYACHGTHQSVIQGLDRHKAKHPIDPKDIRRVIVAAPHFMIHKHADAAPRSVMGAQYSMVFGVAIALTRDIANPYVYSDATVQDPAVRAIAARVETVIDPRFTESTEDNPYAEVTIETTNGRHVVPIKGFKGLPSDPFDFDDACAKLRMYAAPVMPVAQIERIIAMVRNLEQMPDVAELAQLMGA